MTTKIAAFMAELPQVIGTTGIVIVLIGMAFLFGTALIGLTFRK